MLMLVLLSALFFFHATSTTHSYTLSLHDALPISWFKIATPIGSYNPDWAFLTEREEKLYFVRETKGTVDSEELRTKENQKIACRSEEHTSELQSLRHLVCRLLLEKKNKNHTYITS